MYRYRMVIIGLALLVLSAALAFWAVSEGVLPWPRGVPAVRARAALPGPSPAAPPKEEVAITRPTIRHTELGRLAWQVRLSEMKVAAGGQAVAAAGMREALIYDKNGAPIMRLTAQEAKGNTTDGSLEVFGDVRAVSQRGALFTTDKVQWLEKERKLYCPAKVTMRSKNDAVTTRGLDYLVDEDLVKCPNVVRMYSGDNKLIGRELLYNVKTQAFQMKKVQAVFHAEQAKKGFGTAPP